MSETNDKKMNQESLAEDEQQAVTQEQKAEESFEDYTKEELVELLAASKQRTEELEQQLREGQDARLRKMAEFDNYRKRVQRERSQVYDAAKANALEDFLFINDDLHRTLKASQEMQVDQGFLDGLNLIADKFDEVLKKHGVRRIDEEMVPFDVDLHDAMMRQKPEDESIGSDIVLKVLENGYRLGDRTIRHAKVIVSE